MNVNNDSWIDGFDFLRQIKCEGPKFMNLDFFFVPYHNPNLGEHGHYSLLGIAPKQRYVFAIDSLEQTDWNVDLWPLSAIWDILLSQIVENDEEAKDSWSVYSEWSAEKEEKTKMKNCPSCPRQGDMYNCGVFTVTNAMCLAFGWDLMCYSNRDLNPLKRPRMFMELSNTTIDGDRVKTGFKGKYAYDLLEIPSGPVYFSRTGRSARKVVRTNPPFSDSDEDDTNEDDGDKEEDDTYVPLADDDEDDEDEYAEDGENDSDLGEQRGMVDDPNAPKSSDEYSENDVTLVAPIQRRTMSKELGVAIEAAMVADFMRHVPEMFAAWKNSKRYVRYSELARRAFPPQFNAPDFRKAGAFYPPIHVPGSDPPPRFTKDRMERKAVFAYWREQNKIAACVETFWSDEVKPFDGMIDGFKEWLEANPRMGVRKLDLELGRRGIGFGEVKPVNDLPSRSQFVQYIRAKMRYSLANLKRI